MVKIVRSGSTIVPRQLSTEKDTIAPSINSEIIRETVDRTKIASSVDLGLVFNPRKRQLRGIDTNEIVSADSRHNPTSLEVRTTLDTGEPRPFTNEPNTIRTMKSLARLGIALLS